MRFVGKQTAQEAAPLRRFYYTIGFTNPVGLVATTATAAAIVAPTATKTAAAAGTFLAGASFIHGQSAVIEAEAVKAFDRFLGSFLGRHFDKAKPLGAASVAVGDEANFLNFSGLLEQRANRFLGGVVRQITNVQFLRHDSNS
jgi:hypothetical protein